MSALVKRHPPPDAGKRGIQPVAPFGSLPPRPTPVVLPGDREERELRCGKCGRFLCERRVLVALPAGMVWMRVRCNGCDKWRWFDLATGQMVERPMADGA